MYGVSWLVFVYVRLFSWPHFHSASPSPRHPSDAPAIALSRFPSSSGQCIRLPIIRLFFNLFLHERTHLNIEETNVVKSKNGGRKTKEMVVFAIVIPGYTILYCTWRRAGMGGTPYFSLLSETARGGDEIENLSHRPGKKKRVPSSFPWVCTPSTRCALFRLTHSPPSPSASVSPQRSAH